MTKKHIHCDVIKAWADGATIQCRLHDEDAWEAVEDPRWYSEVQYRVKPKPVTKWYRVALFKTGNDVYFGFVSENDYHEKISEDNNSFVRWVTDRQYVEVE